VQGDHQEDWELQGIRLGCYQEREGFAVFVPVCSGPATRRSIILHLYTTEYKSSFAKGTVIQQRRYFDEENHEKHSQ
jgi:hypothetical protein